MVELAKGSALTQSVNTKHIKVLERVGLICRTRAAQRRLARLQLDGLTPADYWLCRAHAKSSVHLDRLEAHLVTQPESVMEVPDA